jgi:hypothetical protein
MYVCECVVCIYMYTYLHNTHARTHTDLDMGCKGVALIVEGAGLEYQVIVA